jgi:hypothetical protein
LEVFEIPPGFCTVRRRRLLRSGRLLLLLLLLLLGEGEESAASLEGVLGSTSLRLVRRCMVNTVVYNNRGNGNAMSVIVLLGRWSLQKGIDDWSLSR